MSVQHNPRKTIFHLPSCVCVPWMLGQSQNKLMKLCKVHQQDSPHGNFSPQQMRGIGGFLTFLRHIFNLKNWKSLALQKQPFFAKFNYTGENQSLVEDVSPYHTTYKNQTFGCNRTSLVQSAFNDCSFQFSIFSITTGNIFHLWRQSLDCYPITHHSWTILLC